MDGNRGAVLVTGASSGMGYACAVRLSEGGFAVFAGVRRQQDAQRLRALGLPRLVPVILDVTDAHTISSALETIETAVGDKGLSGLVNNAGIAVTAPIELVSIEELRRQFETNVVGQVAVTQAALPLIRAARGRIVNVGSVGAKFALPFGGPLCSSKSAIESINDSLRMELRPWGIHVVLISPGSIRTVAAHKLVADGEVTANGFTPDGRSQYGAAYRAFIQAFLKLEDSGVGPEVMAEAVFRALTLRTPKKRYPVGPKSRLLPFIAAVLPRGAADLVRTRLFNVYQPFGVLKRAGKASG